MSQHAYPTSAMLGDYLRALAGLVPAGVILATEPLGAVAATVLGGFATLFAVFGIRTALRHGTRIELTETALRASGLSRASVAWDELDCMKLAYYSTRRDGRGGWMQLELRSAWSTLRIDNRIAGFTALVEASARAAETRGLILNAITLENLRALGVNQNFPELGLRAAAGGAA